MIITQVRKPSELFIANNIASKMQVIYGTEKLVETYSGPCVRLRRVSDNATQDFSFSGSRLDKASIDSFAGASKLRIEIWYDQSGNGYNLTSSVVSTERPSFSFDHNLLPVVGFADYANNAMGTQPEYMTCSSGSFTTNNLSVMQCVRWLDQSDTQPYSAGVYQIDQANSTRFIEYSGRSNLNSSAGLRYQTRYQFVNGNQKTYNASSSSFSPNNTSFGIIASRSNATNLRVKNGNWWEKTATAVSGLSCTGFDVGCAFDQAFPSCQHLTAWMAGEALTDVEESLVSSVLASRFYAVESAIKQVIVDGDSISAAYTESFYDDRTISWATRLQKSLWPGVLVRNKSISGAHIDGTANGGDASLSMKDSAIDRINELYNASAFTSQLLIVWAGTNDIFYLTGSDGDAEIVHARLQAYCTARRGLGFEVLVIGPIPRGPFDAGKDTELSALNSLIASNYTGYADGYINMMTEDWTPGGSYAANYLPDEIHLNATGHTKAAAIIYPVVASML
jgi:lysophospholipase L1-like esterase